MRIKIAALALIPFLFFLAGCFDDAGTPRNVTSFGRLIVIEDNGVTAILKDNKTGCEFAYAYMHDGLALIPGTCNDSVNCK